MGSKLPTSPEYPDPCAEYLYTPPPGVTLKTLHTRWKGVDSKAYSFQLLRNRSATEKWVDRRSLHWEEVHKREEELQVNIDAHAAAHYRRINCETVVSVQAGLKTATELAARRLQMRFEANIDAPKADYFDTNILVKAAVGSEIVARVWAGFHGIVPIDNDVSAAPIVVEFVIPEWAVDDIEPESLPQTDGAKIIDLVPSNGSNGSNGA